MTLDLSRVCILVSFAVIGEGSGGCGNSRCLPATCSEFGAECGPLEDGCGGVLDCGSCPAPSSCGGAGVPNACGCSPRTCAGLGKNCGSITDGCGNTLTCGTCSTSETCGGGGVANVCGCTAMTCLSAGMNCGTVSDGCGGMLDCGTCDARMTCGGGGTPNQCGWTVPAPGAASCSADHWCLESGLPGNSDLYAVCGSGTGDVWAVGAAEPFAAGGEGTILHWDGTAWTQVSSPVVDASLTAVWSSGPQDAWIVSDRGDVAHWTGPVTGWTVSAAAGVISKQLLGVWSSGPGDAWVVGDVVAHWNGLAWTQSTEVTVGSSVWGSPSTGEVWVVGQGPAGAGVLHYDGSNWSLSPTPEGTAPLVQSVWGRSPKDVWAVGGSAALHWDGNQWTSVPLPAGTTLQKVWGSTGGSDLWGIGFDQLLSWNGSTWSSVSYPGAPAVALASLWGSATGDAWAVGSSGIIEHWDGSTWTWRSLGVTVNLAGAWAESANDIWVVGDKGTAIHGNGTQWSIVPTGTTNALSAVWGDAAADVWAVGDKGTTLHWNGTAWTSMVSGTTAGLHGVAGTGSSDIWAVGDRGTILHWDGTLWWLVQSDVGADLYAVWARTLDDTWVAGDGTWQWGQCVACETDAGVEGAYFTGALHWDGSSWNTPNGANQFPPSLLLTGIWSSGPGDVWLIGTFPSAHWNGSVNGGVWSQGGVYGTAVSGGSPKDVVVVGESLTSSQGTISRWNGSQWSPADPGMVGALNGVWEVGPSAIWAIGEGGVILHLGD
jgi:hypothetical protein